MEVDEDDILSGLVQVPQEMQEEMQVPPKEAPDQDENLVFMNHNLKSPDDSLAYCNSAFEKGSLSCHHFREWWRRVVPKLLSPTATMDYQSPQAHIDDDAVQSQLLRPLEQFLCDGDPDEVMKVLSGMSDPPAQCGKLFKMGDPTYTCKDCGHDPTCVLCVDCFTNSEHRHHRYKMSTSFGGGYCDCGDDEAWTSGVHCGVHIAGAERPSNEDPLSKMPQNIQDRSRFVFKSVMRYVFEILTAETVLNLPPDLTFREEQQKLDLEGDAEDKYCTVVFNDEHHTFDEVISALPRAVDCDRNGAISFATLIDREGRAVVKCANFGVCTDAKKIIDRITGRRGRPLKVSIMHSHMVAHQTFALRLVNWIQNYIDFSSAFRAIFASIVLEKSTSDRRTIVESFCRSDIVLWKAVRAAIHHLMISGMLKEAEAKRQFACEFAKSYGQLMKDFILDDHEHSNSVTGLSVQLFTGPTLAYHLIANEHALAILANTFKSESDRKKNGKGKIEFQRHANLNQFNRAYFILYDMKYLLSTLPTEETWNDRLRTGFLHGVSLMLDILASMQGMDQQVRQVGNHLEYELEWETAFNIHIKVAPVISLICGWAGTDRVVFIKTIRMVLKKLFEVQQSADPEARVSHEICGQTATCVDYQVSSSPVSFHLPLTRLLAGLSLHLEKFGLDLHSNELQISDRPQLQEMMEPSLRTLVLVAQVQAGMWRRNGYAMSDQVRVYFDPRCRKEMFDQDVIMLQLVAANMEGNEFLIHLLNKYQLMQWANPGFDGDDDESMKQIASLIEEFLGSITQLTTLVEEFLGVLIVILSERFNPGVGQVSIEDCMKKELIQLLCVEPMSHSNLNKALSEDVVNRETGMERVVENVATFKKPSRKTLTKGVYELKDEFYPEYNVFFYHYSKEEQSKSEEAQLKRRKAANLPQCCPPPLPPKFSDLFKNALKLIDCQVFLHCISIVLQRADNLKSRCFSERQVHKTLHLIGLCLLEEERSRTDQDHVQVNFIEKANQFNILAKLENLVGNQRIESHKDLLQWVVHKWKAMIGVIPMEEVAEASTSESSPSEDDPEKERRRALAAARRARILEQMKAAQSNFIKDNKDLFDDSGPSEKSKAKRLSLGEPEVKEVDPVCLGPDKSNPVTTDNHFICILCQEEQLLTKDGPALVMAAYVQKSTVLSRRKFSDGEPVPEPAQNSPYDRCPILQADMTRVPHTSSCGHIMHSTCWFKYVDDLVNQLNQRISRQRNPQSFDIEKQEFLCPLCRCLSNTAIPIIPQFHVLQPVSLTVKTNSLDFTQWIEALLIALKYRKEISVPSDVPDMDDDESETTEAEASTSAAAKAKEVESNTKSKRQRFYTCPIDQVTQELDQKGFDSEAFARIYLEHEGSELHFSPSLFKMMNLFCQTVFQRSLDHEPQIHDERIPMMVWQTCSFTIHSIVWSILDDGKSIFDPMSSRQHDCLSTLVRFSGIVGSNFGDPKLIRSHALKLLATLFEVDTANMSILEFDAFGFLVALTFSLPSLFNDNQPAPLPACNIQDMHILHLVFLLHLVQILLTTDQFSNDDIDDDTDDDPEFLPILQLLREVRETVGFAADGDGTEGLRAKNVWQDLTFASLPFLRSCALFYHILSSVPVPAHFKQYEDDEFVTLTKYLALPSSPAELLRSSHMLDLAKRWSNHPNVHIMLSPTSNTTPVTYPMKVNTLVTLPHDYSELINSLSSFTCPKSISDDSRVPAMCLICGTIVCSQSYCCQSVIQGDEVGACTAHAHHCGAGNGIFLRIRECKVILLSGRKKGCFLPPPYVDEYGEFDLGLRRGNPLNLCPERLRSIHKIWLNHRVPEEIAHVVETNLLHLATPWNHL